MLHKSFNRGLHRLIKKVEWPMYVINVDQSHKCKCLNHQANTGNVNCPYCLGSGYKIKIRKIMGVKQPYESKFKMSTELDNLVTTYYFDQKYAPIKKGDYIVMNDEIDVIRLTRNFRSDSGDTQFIEAPAVLKKYDNQIFLENFHRIVGE